MQLIDKADTWFKNAQEPSGKKGPWRAQLDTALKGFVLSNDVSIKFPALDGTKRLWVHSRAEQLALKSDSHIVSNKKWIKNVTLTKPSGWNMDWELAQPLRIIKKKKSWKFI